MHLLDSAHHLSIIIENEAFSQRQKGKKRIQQICAVLLKKLSFFFFNVVKKIKKLLCL